jgi:hypothetical protein
LIPELSLAVASLLQQMTPTRYDHRTDPEALLNEREAADFLGLEPMTLTTWRAQAREIPYVRLGHKTVRYRRADLVAWVMTNRHRVTLADRGHVRRPFRGEQMAA